jgi:hypothetical protein
MDPFDFNEYFIGVLRPQGIADPVRIDGIVRIDFIDVEDVPAQK